MTINSLSEEGFVSILKKYISPSKPISSIELLHGRSTALRTIEKALHADGRHIFIYGERGVGKSSLAQTAASQYQSSDNEFLIVDCGPDTTFERTITSIVRQVVTKSPEINETNHKFIISAEWLKYEFNNKKVSSKKSLCADTIDEATQVIREIGALHSERPIIVIDEFDSIKEDSERTKFAIFLKHLGDKNINVKFIFSGIGETLDSLIGSHLSSIRQLETIQLERLSWDARWEILTSAAEAFGVNIENDFLIRIAGISDGFPYYVHLIAEKLFWHLFESSDGKTKVTKEDYYAAIDSAILGISPHLKKPYEQATICRDAQYAYILWAAADAYDLHRNNQNIYKSYTRITKELKLDPIDRAAFNRRLNTLKSKSSSSLIMTIPNRNGWSRFRESMVRGYVRLLAESNGVPLDVESFDTTENLLSARPKGHAKRSFRELPSRPGGFRK